MKTLAEHAAKLRFLATRLDYCYAPDEGDPFLTAADALEQAAEVLRAVEWRGVAPDRHSWLEDAHCVGCEHSQPNGHAPDCKLAALIGAKASIELAPASVSEWTIIIPADIPLGAAEFDPEAMTIRANDGTLWDARTGAKVAT